MTTTTITKPSRRQKREEERHRLEAAFQRLLSQDPADPRLEDDELREMLEEHGRVPVTQDNVAKEAGVSRKLVTGSDCPFPELAARIRSVRTSHGVAPTTTAQLDDLRKENASLKHTVTVIRSKMAEAVLRADRAAAETAQQKALVDRLRKQMGRRVA